MKAFELKNKFYEFFTHKAHTKIRGSSLIPENDPTVLFTTAGMHPLVPYIMGQEHPEGRRLVNCQRCIRTKDIEEVGDTSHLTFFEMLGNWSLGDYFKQEAIEMSFEFLTDAKWLNLKIEDLAISVYEGDSQVPADEESAKLWEQLGIPRDKIFFLSKQHNWWGPAGQTGPCGPDSEMFIDTHSNDDAASNPASNDGRFLEIWNDVFMQYNKTSSGSFEPLGRTCVDTGMGLERTASILQGKPTVYHTELFMPLIHTLETISSYRFETSPIHDKSMRIIADHIRAAVFILGDERAVNPSNIGQGYILRRLIRRAMRYGRQLEIDRLFLKDIAEVIIETYAVEYSQLQHQKASILNELEMEEKKFSETLKKGEKEFYKLVEQLRKKNVSTITGNDVFHLYDTYGFPKEITVELAIEQGLSIDDLGFEKAFKEHQEKSKADTNQTFKGGLLDNSEETTKLHTATHLLHQALRQVLGTHVSQKGSNITKERLRFDFSHEEKMTAEQVTSVEQIVNEQIQGALPVTMQTMSLEEAQKQGALAFFGEKYDEQVKVYSIGEFSKEVCGGPHVKNTKELGMFKIDKEQSSSRGVRRIKAVLKSKAGT